MKVAYLVSDGEHSHCYGSDFLFVGLVNNLGFGSVLDWPEKPPLHCSVVERTHFDVPLRDTCQIASDSAFPRRGTTPYDLLDADVAIIALPPYAPDAGRIAELCRGLPRSMPIAALDASDRVENCAGWYSEIAGRSLAGYFKREYPIGASWPGTFACPLSYPASRVGELEWGAKRGVFYHATDHGGGAPGVPRQAIQRSLLGIIAANRAVVDVAFDISLTPSQENRLSPEEYHACMAQALVGISYNGAVNWDCNRFWENLAYGLCQVAERPTIQIPNPPLDGVHCYYVGTPDEAAQLVWALLNDEERAGRIARAGHAHFLRHHSSEARARYVLGMLSLVG